MHDIYDPPPAPVPQAPPPAEPLFWTRGDVLCLVLLCVALVAASWWGWRGDPGMALLTAVGGALVVLESWFTALGFLDRHRELGLRARWMIFMAALAPWLVGLGFAAMMMVGLFLAADWVS